MNDIPKPPKSKFDKLFNIFERCHASLAEVPDRRISALLDSWVSAKAEYPRFLSAGVSKSTLAAGLEQGLRELPLFFSELAPQYRTRMTAVLKNAVNDFYPEFASREALRLEQILTRGAIRSESQFYLVRHRIDELECTDADANQLNALYKLTDAFEARRRN